MRNLFALLPALLLVLACGKPAPVASAQSSKAEIPEGWAAYEDDWFKVHYPAGSDVGGGPAGKQNPEFPVLGIVPPSSKEDTFGTFALQPDTVTRGMLLRDAIESEMKKQVTPRGSILLPAREFKVGNGKCLSGITSRPGTNCPKGSGSCYSPVVVTVCDDFSGRRYNIDSPLSGSQDPKGLSPKAQQEAAVYERILRSLEFKKS